MCSSVMRQRYHLGACLGFFVLAVLCYRLFRLCGRLTGISPEKSYVQSNLRPNAKFGGWRIMVLWKLEKVVEDSRESEVRLFVECH